MDWTRKRTRFVFQHRASKEEKENCKPSDVAGFGVRHCMQVQVVVGLSRAPTLTGAIP
jgi:hypothetical protein